MLFHLGIFINKFIQKCQYYYTLLDQSIPLVTITSVVSLLSKQLWVKLQLYRNFWDFLLLIHFLSKLFMQSSNYNSCTTYLRFNFDIEDCIQDRVGRVYNPEKFSCKSAKLKQKDYYYLQMHKVQIVCECHKNLTQFLHIIRCYTK